MKLVRDILATKSEGVWTIFPKATLYEALELMRDEEIGALVVKDPAGKVVGIFSERDYARKVILAEKTSRETRVEEIMTPASRMIIVGPENTIVECMALMTQNHIRHLPVFERERLVGIVSGRDLIKTLIEARAHHIDNLHDLSETLFTQLYDDQIAGSKG
jgi:CBS domain-containing protein